MDGVVDDYAPLVPETLATTSCQILEMGNIQVHGKTATRERQMHDKCTRYSAICSVFKRRGTLTANRQGFIFMWSASSGMMVRGRAKELVLAVPRLTSHGE